MSDQGHTDQYSSRQRCLVNALLVDVNFAKGARSGKQAGSLVFSAATGAALDLMNATVAFSPAFGGVVPRGGLVKRWARTTLV